MGSRKKGNLTEIIHLRVSADTKAWYEKYSEKMDISEADLERLALEMFRQRGGVAYAKEDN